MQLTKCGQTLGTSSTYQNKNFPCQHVSGNIYFVNYDYSISNASMRLIMDRCIRSK
jgi:hypothetical protein